MKETRFIAQNKEKWQDSENLLREREKDPEKLSNLFTQVIDDLSYARTYYPNRSVRLYLNSIARAYFSLIYGHQRNKKNSFAYFWLDELPQIVYMSRKPLLLSLIVFCLAIGIGIFSSMKDPAFSSAILGDRYVEMTKANIEKGDPMAGYKEAHEVEMFLGITLNNLMVAFRTYVFGIFLSIGTLAILLFNGVMVGCFQFFFIERGLFVESALTIWLHGALEIPMIVLAGGAGLTLGSGLLFPGGYSRLQAFQLSAIRSLKLMLGITPIIVMAAVIESFVTRYTEIPDVIRLLLILMSVTFVVGYFVVYPWRRSRRGFDKALEETRLAPANDEPVSFTGIKNNGEIIKDTFALYKKHFRKLFPWIVAVTALMTGAEWFAPVERMFALPAVNPWWTMFSTMYYATKTPHLSYLLINSLGTTFILYRVFTLVGTEARKGGWRVIALVQSLSVLALGYGVIYLFDEMGAVLILGLWGWLFLLCVTQQTEGSLLPAAIGRSLNIGSANAGQVFGMQLIFVLLSFSFLIIISAPVVYLNTSILQWNFAESDTWSEDVIRFLGMFLKVLAFNLVLPVFAFGIACLYFSLKEIESATNLKKSILQMGARHAKEKKP